MRRSIKYFLLSLILASGITPSAAQTVTEKRAQSIAQTFFLHDSNTAPGARVRLLADPAAPLTKGGALPAYYIFNRDGGGFVIISAEEVCIPVLAYSFTNSFNTAEIPENLRDLLLQWHDQVEFVRTKSLRANSAEKMRWVEAESVTKASDGLYKEALKHETGYWKQGSPFNDKAPMVDGHKAVAGCSAIAMGLIMKFWEYPDHGTGTLPSYNYKTEQGNSRSQAGHPLGHKYDWTKIKLNYNGNYSKEEGEQVAQLVYDCGVMAKSTFDTSTGAVFETMIDAAVQYMGYDAGATIYERGYFTDAEWIAMLKKELQTQPVYYTGRTAKNSGHAFVVDGYDNRDYLSVNWGWASDDNGYYQLSAFAPSSNHSYTLKHKAIFGLKPDCGGGNSSYLYLLPGEASNGKEMSGLKSSMTIIPGRAFTMDFGLILNKSREYFNGKIALALADKSDTIREFISDEIELSISPDDSKCFFDVPCMMNLYPKIGDKVRLFYCSGKSPEVWKPIFYNRELDGLTGEIFVADTQTIDDATSFYFNRDDGRVVMHTKSGLDWKLTDSHGVPVTEGVSYDVTTITINTKLLAKDTYTLTLSKGEEVKSFTITMGLKQ